MGKDQEGKRWGETEKGGDEKLGWHTEVRLHHSPDIFGTLRSECPTLTPFNQSSR